MSKALRSLSGNRILAGFICTVVFMFIGFQSFSATVFSENIGSPGGTTAIASYTGWQNNGVLTFTGTADVRNTGPSSGYSGASGSGNVFITNVAGRDFQIASINTSSYTSLSLSFGIFKSTTTGTGSDLIVEISSDGTSYTALSYPALPTGTGTATWFLRTATGTIPSTANLRIRFRQTGATTQYRIDDVILSGNSIATPPANDLCGSAIALSIPSGSVSGTLVNSTFTSPFANKDVWYSFNATCNGSYTINLSGFTGDVDIELFGSSCPSSTTFLFNSNGTTSTEVISETLSPGTYFLRVLAYNAAAESSTFTVSLTSLCPCPSPTANSTSIAFAGNTFNSVSGSFTKASPEPSGGYLVIQSTSASLSSFPVDANSYSVGSSVGGGTVVANVTPTGAATYPFSSSGLAGNTQYYYTVIPYNFQSGVCLHAYANGLRITGTTFTCPPAPAAPTTGTVTSSTAQIFFTSPGGTGTITSYDLQWKPSPSGPVTTVTGVTSPYTLTGLTANSSYEVSVRASNVICTGPYSAALIFTTAQLNAPTANNATNICPSSFHASWTAVSGASGYQLDVSTSPTFSTVNTATDLFISEYVEGSSNNKYIEIFNGTGAPINLSDYQLRNYSNGSSSPTFNNTLSGTLAPGTTAVFSNSSATIYGGASTSLTSVVFNGDDAVVLFKISTSSFVDIVGRIGEDPGTAWTAGGGYSTLNKTLVRKLTVTEGVTTNPASGFPTLASEWDLYNEDDVSNLGSHDNSTPFFVSGYENMSVAGTSQIVTGLSPAITYYYRARSTSATSTSANSNVVSVTTSSSLAAPVAISASGVGCNSFTARWDAATDATAYFIDVATDNSFSTFVPLWNNRPVGNVTSAVVAGLTTGGTYHYRVRAAYTCGASSSSNTIDVTLNSAPQITSCPGGVVIFNDNDFCNGTVTYPEAEASGTPTPVITYSQNSGTTFPVGTTTVYVTATNSCGTATCSFDVTVVDNQPPTISCPSTQTLSLGSSCAASLPDYTSTASVSDNCSLTPVPELPAEAQEPGTIVVTQSPAPGTPLSGTGTIIVTLTATDEAGNLNSCQFGVNVQDNTPPAAACQDATVQLDAFGNGAVTVSQVDNGCSDNCGVTSISIYPYEFNCSNVGPNSVTLTVTDVNNNSATCSAVVTVEDDIAPVAGCQDITVSLNQFGYVTVSGSQINNGSSDACGILSLTASPNTFYCSNTGDNPVTLVVTDNNGNSSGCSSVVTVVDDSPPSASCQSITVELNGDGTASITASDIDYGSDDNCGVASFSVSPDAFTCANVGANNVILTVTDANSNSSLCSAVVTVQDNTVPDAVCKDITVFLNGAGNVSINADDINDGSFDACGIISSGVSPSSFNCSNVGDNPVTLTVGDANGNSSGCVSLVTVVDNTPPVAVCTDFSVQLDNLGEATITSAEVDGGSSDACGIALLQISNDKFGCDDVGPNTVTLTVIDNYGNVSTCEALVLVQDKAPVVALCQNVTVYLDANGLATVTASQLDNGSHDNCGISDISADVTTFTCADIGANSVTITVTDNSGNSSECTSTVTVGDNIPPSALCRNVTVTLSGGTASITVADINNGSFDNCGVSSLSAMPLTFNCSNIGANAVTLTVTDISGYTASCVAAVQVTGVVPGCTLAAIPANSTYTGGVPTNIYLGYGPQTVALKPTVSGGSSFSYSWSGLSTSRLSCTNCAQPVFTPLTTGNYTFTVTITNEFGCVSSCSITICVLDVRSANGKVYLSHYPSGSLPCPASQMCNTLSIASSAVPAHLAHTCDHLGACTGTQICGGPVAKDGGEEFFTETENEDGFGVRVFPNPFAGQFNLKITTESNENVEVKIFDVLGHLMEQIKGVSPFDNIYLGNDLSKGVYLIEVIQGEQVGAVRVVKSE